MKMILTMVEDSISGDISRALLTHNFRVTKMATTSGFLREGATTLMVGVDDAKVSEALQVIRDTIPIDADSDKFRATVYVLNVKDFSKL